MSVVDPLPPASVLAWREGRSANDTDTLPGHVRLPAYVGVAADRIRCRHSRHDENIACLPGRADPRWRPATNLRFPTARAARA